MTKILDGKLLADCYCAEIKAEVDRLSAKQAAVPCLGVILVGENPASQAYVANKEKTARRKCGFETKDFFLPASATQAEVAAAVSQMNQDAAVDGILLQLPLPDHLQANELLDLINPEKDADGLHPVNQGLLQRGEAELRPCTPSGVLALLDLAYCEQPLSKDFIPSGALKAQDLSGKKAVVIGRSILVGKPVATMLLERNATVTIAHSKTPNLPAVCAEADILVAAVGRPNMVQADWVKTGAVVLDVGINRLPDGRLTGDVNYETVANKCAAITPVPGGVGPMTVAMLMKNTLIAFKKKNGRP